jgi:hypothetical protein
MRHVILTCTNHPNLRWSCKEIAVSNGKYNGIRNIRFLGEPSGKGMYADGSGLDCTTLGVEECLCNGMDTFVIAPEDKLVTKR